jgi:hypothetical protein
MDTLSQLFGECQQWLFETAIQPALFHLGLSNFIEDGYDATMWLLVGLLQVAVLVLVFACGRWSPSRTAARSAWTCCTR